MKNSISILAILMLTICTCFSQITISFTVDIPGMYIGPGGVHIAGQFLSTNSISIIEDWQPGASGSEMTLISGTTYRVDVSFPSSSAGASLQFEFVRDSVWMNSNGDMSEGNPGDCCLDYSCGVDDGGGGINRIVTIPDCAGSYTCVWNNCASLVVSSLPTLTVTPQDTIICTGQTIQLSATSNGIVSWFPDPTLSCLACNSPIASPDTSTLFFVTAAIGNCQVTDTIMVSVGQPALSIPDDTLLCAGDSIQLTATGTGTILWSPATGLSCSLCDSPVASPVSTTLYFVSSIVGNCSVEDSMMITVDAIIVDAGGDESIMLGESVQLNASGASDYLWGPSEGLSCTDCPSPVASPVITTSYVVSATSDYGCKGSDTVMVFVTTLCEGIFFPNAFTPNGDGRNDQFGPLSEVHPAIRIFSIFNRWGQRVFQTSDFNRQWDGNFNGRPQLTGGYVYILEFDCEGRTLLIKGDLALIR